MVMHANINGEDVELPADEEAAILAERGALAPGIAEAARVRAIKQAYAAAIAAGVVVTSTGTPAISGTYTVADIDIMRITSEQVYIATTGKFTNGQASKAWLDASGVGRTFPNVALFTAFAEAVALYVDTLITVQAQLLAGQTVAWPSAAITLT